MFSKRCWLLFPLLFITFNTPVWAGLMIAVESKSIPQNSGVQPVDIFIRTTSMDSLLSLTMDLELSGGQFDLPAGSLGLPGFVGASNLNLVSAVERNMSDPQVVSISIDFNSSQPMPLVDTPIARLYVDVSGLPQGPYSIDFLDSLAIGDTPNILINNTSGVLTIVPQVIPEPGSWLLASLSMGTLWIRRRREVA